MRFKVITVLLIIFVFGFQVEAQEPYAQSLSVTNGLPSDAVYSILEDSKGYIWITCNEGLFRYDGKNFKSYKANQQIAFAGSALMEDEFGRIWYQNFDGACFYVENEKLTELNGYQKGGYLEQQITDNHLFIPEKNGIVIFDLKTLKRIKKIPLHGIKNIPNLCSWKNDFYFTAQGILYTLNRDLVPIELCKLPKSYRPNYKIIAHQNGIDIQITGTENPEIWRYSKTNNSVQKRFILPSNVVIQNLSYCENALWVQTTKGIFRYRGDDQNYSNHYYKTQNFSDQIIDQKNNYWFTSPISGIRIVPEFNTNFFDLDNLSGLKFLVEDNEELLISSHNDEIATFNASNAKVNVIYKGNNNAEIYYLFKDKIEGHLIFVSSDGSTYFAPHGDLKNKVKFNIAIKQICSIETGIFGYVSSETFGFIVFPEANKQSKWLKNLNNIPFLHENGITVYNNIDRIRCRAILYDSLQQQIYFTSTLACFRYKDGEVSTVGNVNSFSNFTQLFQIGNRNFAVSIDGKIYEIKSDNYCKEVSSSFGLDKSFVQSAKFQGNYLIVKTPERILMLLRKNDGNFLQTNFFDRTNKACSAYNLQNEILWIMTNEGLIKWYHQSKNRRIHQGKFIISYVTMNDKSIKWQQNQAFHYDENNLFIKFSILDFGLQTIEKIQYKVNDAAWEDIGMDVRSLNLPALYAAKYKISLRAIYLNGDQAEQTIRFSILKPFWMTVGFYVLIFSACILIILLGFRHQIKQIKLRNSLKTDKLNLESDLQKSLLSSIKAQMNPHFIFNALNTIQAYIYMNDKKNATGYLSRFSMLTRHILAFSEKEKVSLVEEIKALKLYLELEQMRFQKDFVYEINHASIDLSNILIPSMLIQPYVENAIKHGLLHLAAEKILKINFVVSGEILIVTIDDNGIGRDRSAEINLRRNQGHESFSTKANEKRLELLNNSNEIGVEIIDKFSTKKQAIGTTVILRINLKK